MYALILLAVLLADCRSANVNKHLRLIELDNNIHSNAVVRGPRRFLSISAAPAARVAHAPGESLPLTCEAFGAPAPTVRWFKNDQPVYEHNHESAEEFESSPTSLAKVTSTLLVTRTAGEDRYTCVATSGGKTTRAHTTVYSTGKSSVDLLDRSRLLPRAPRILVSYKVLVDVIGSRAVLPCRARARPRPRVVWASSRGVVDDPRMKVLRSGELVISSLQWSDMGAFTCVASNAFGKQIATTFVYPAKVGKMNKVKH